MARSGHDPEVEQAVTGKDYGLVLDDHTYMRQAMRRCVVEAGIEEVVEVTSLAEARQALVELGPPRIAVLDLRLPDGLALELLPEMKEAGVATIVFTSADDGYSVRAAYAAGASGYVLKSSEHDQVLHALRTVLQGGVHVDHQIAALLVTGVQTATSSSQLTDREVEILQLAAQGLGNAEIAEKIGVTTLAVKGHFARIGKKLGASDRTHMVAEAMRADLLR